MEYAAFSDESRHTHGRYRCIAAVSLPARSVRLRMQELNRCLQQAGITELKWRELRGSNRVACALRFIDLLIDNALEGEFRTDVLIWDTADARHTVPEIDHLLNYERMFFHLHRFLMGKRGAGAVWHLRPDQQIRIDWSTLESCLRSDGTWRPHAACGLLSDEFPEIIPALRTFRQVSSESQPLCQLADLLAGMAPYTRERARVIRAQFVDEAGQHALFEGEEADVSARDRDRFRVILHLYQRCRSHGLGVSLRTGGFLRTHDPNRPINFWHYEPQHQWDRAPQRRVGVAQQDQPATPDAELRPDDSG